KRANGWSRRAIISSWATTATIARIVGGWTNRMLRVTSRSRIWSVKPCEFGLILILVTDLSGSESELRFNKRPIRENFYALKSIRTPVSTRRAPRLRRRAPPPPRHAPTSAWNDLNGDPLHSGAPRAHRLCRSALDAPVLELPQGRSQHGSRGL